MKLHWSEFEPGGIFSFKFFFLLNRAKCLLIHTGFSGERCGHGPFVCLTNQYIELQIYLHVCLHALFVKRNATLYTCTCKYTSRTLVVYQSLWFSNLCVNKSKIKYMTISNIYFILITNLIFINLASEEGVYLAFPCWYCC